MKRLAILTLLALGWLVPLQARAETRYSCGQGIVRNVQSITETVATPTLTSRLVYLVTVQFGGRVYTGLSAADVEWNLDPMRLAIDQPISICANDTQMVLDRQDGTDYRARIVRIVRAGKTYAGTW